MARVTIARNPTKRYRRRLHMRAYSFEQRLVDAVGNHIRDTSSGAKSAKDLRAKMRKLIDNDEFWLEIDELAKLGKKLGSVFQNL
jgi:hypothetical protein